MEIKLQTNNALCKERCALCWEWFKSEAIIATVYDGMEHIGYACQSCLAAGPLGVRDRMHETAEHLHAAAEELEQLSNELIIMPSLSEYEAQRDKLDPPAPFDDVVSVADSMEPLPF